MKNIVIVTPALSPTDASNLQPPDIAELAGRASVRIVCDTGEDQDANRRQAPFDSKKVKAEDALIAKLTFWEMS
jgi:hypothetical protein